MPWVKQELCTGCGVCVQECPVDAVDLGDDGYAAINDEECIRCGRCHDACPQEAVRHDGERIPQDISENLLWVKKLLGNFHQPTEQAAFMQRMVRYFKKEQKIAQETLAKIEAVGDDPVKGIDAAIQSIAQNQSS